MCDCMSWKTYQVGFGVGKQFVGTELYQVVSADCVVAPLEFLGVGVVRIVVAIPAHQLVQHCSHLRRRHLDNEDLSVTQLSLNNTLQFSISEGTLSRELAGGAGVRPLNWGLSGGRRILFFDHEIKAKGCEGKQTACNSFCFEQK